MSLELFRAPTNGNRFFRPLIDFIETERCNGIRTEQRASFDVMGRNPRRRGTRISEGNEIPLKALAVVKKMERYG